MKKLDAKSDDAQANTLFQRGEALHDAGRHEEALAQYRAAAALGHGEAMASVGFAYDQGEGVARDAVQAHEWFKRSAATGDGVGLFNLACQFRLGVPDAGVEANHEESMRLIRKAAEAGIPEAMHNLGLWLAEADPDDPEQVVWFRNAAVEGDAKALCNLGVCFEQGRGGLGVSIEAAHAMFQQAAERGNAAAMFNLGGAHAHGKGVPQNLPTAAMWLERASAAGHPGAPAALAQVEKLIAQERAAKKQPGRKAAPASKSALCGACGKPAGNRCSGCAEKFYCSVDCQRAHWSEHKLVCKTKQAAQKKR